jgi:hypothetical protein
VTHPVIFHSETCDRPQSIAWHVFFLYFYVISNFGVPYMTRHFDNIALLHMISILLDS